MATLIKSLFRDVNIKTNKDEMIKFIAKSKNPIIVRYNGICRMIQRHHIVRELMIMQRVFECHDVEIKCNGKVWKHIC